jgi:hypothetical protein
LINVAMLALVFTSAMARFNITGPAEVVPEHPLCDNSTYGNVEEIATSHYHVDW